MPTADSTCCLVPLADDHREVMTDRVTRSPARPLWYGREFPHQELDGFDGSKAPVRDRYIFSIEILEAHAHAFHGWIPKELSSRAGNVATAVRRPGNRSPMRSIVRHLLSAAPPD